MAGSGPNDVGQGSQDGGAGGRGQLDARWTFGQRDAAQQFGRGRGGDAALAVRNPDRPVPVGTGEATRRSTPSRSQPTAVPTMSAIESAAPTSWKWTFSIVCRGPWPRPRPGGVKIGLASSFCRGGKLAGIDHGQ